MISPWNYPLYLGIGDVLPALLAGNAVVSKADSQTVLTLLWARELMADAGVPTDVWQVVVGAGSTIGNPLIDHVDFVCFTGSTRTGRAVGARAGERLIGCSLELGGKNPMLVREDADLAKAADGLIAAAFANSGQMCISIERVIVHEKVATPFLDLLADRVRALTVGQTFDFSVDMGTLTSADQLATVQQHVDDATEKGATIRVGGKARPDVGPLAFEPTVLSDVTSDMKVYAEETFGPVVSVYTAPNDDAAIALANEGSYGLSASIWSRDVTTARRLAGQLRAGAVNINDGAAAAAGSIEAPMGGMGDSGIGRRHGAEGIRKFTEPQTVAVQRLIPLGPPPGLAVERFIALTNGQLKLLRRLRVR
jgi:succinate-semialdehyde dehydrogenase/glutarate-semialdehyde dehydrogenase